LLVSSVLPGSRIKITGPTGAPRGAGCPR